MGKPITIHINREYMKKYFAEQKVNAKKLSIQMGKSDSYISVCLNKKQMDKTAMLLLCSLTGMDFEKATTEEKPKEQEVRNVSREATNAVTTDDVAALAEVVVSYIQDIGKINSDLLREVRDTKTMVVAALDVSNKTLKEVERYIKNNETEKRQARTAMNNAIQETRNTVNKLCGIVQGRK